MQKHRARKRAAIAAAATAAIGPAAVPLVVPDTAAAASPGFCASNSVCLYRDVGFAGTVASFRGNDNSYTDNTFVNGQPLNDKVSAVWNNTGRYVALCKDAGFCAGGTRAVCLAPGVAVRDLRPAPNYNDQISAHAFFASNPGCVDGTVASPQGCSI